MFKHLGELIRSINDALTDIIGPIAFGIVVCLMFSLIMFWPGYIIREREAKAVVDQLEANAPYSLVATYQGGAILQDKSGKEMIMPNFSLPLPKVSRWDESPGIHISSDGWYEVVDDHRAFISTVFDGGVILNGSWVLDVPKAEVIGTDDLGFTNEPWRQETSWREWRWDNNINEGHITIAFIRTPRAPEPQELSPILIVG